MSQAQTRGRAVSSATNPMVKTLAGLRLKKNRDASGLFLSEGLRAGLDALKAGAVPRVVAHVPGRAVAQELAPLLRATQAAGGQCLEVTAEIIAKITRKDNPQSVVTAHAIERRRFDRIKPTPADLYVALDRVRDPGNLGTVVRTAHAIGAAGVMLIDECCDAYATEAVRASMGSIFAVPIYEGSAADFAALARDWPGLVVGTSPRATRDYLAARYQPPVLAVLGAEQDGMSPVVAGACAEVVAIPLYGQAESLNVSVAAGVLLYGIRQALRG